MSLTLSESITQFSKEVDGVIEKWAVILDSPMKLVLVSKISVSCHVSSD